MKERTSLLDSRTMSVMIWGNEVDRLKETANQLFPFAAEDWAHPEFVRARNLLGTSMDVHEYTFLMGLLIQMVDEARLAATFGGA